MSPIARAFMKNSNFPPMYRAIYTALALSLLLALSTLSGCATDIPLEGENSKPKIAHDLDINADSILSMHRCGISKYGPDIRAFECVYIDTPTYASLLTYDSSTKRFREGMRIAKETDAIALASHWSVFGTIAQMHIVRGDQRYVLDFINGDSGKTGHFQDMQSAYQHLRDLGVPETGGLPYVEKSIQKVQVVFIP